MGHPPSTAVNATLSLAGGVYVGFNGNGVRRGWDTDRRAAARSGYAPGLRAFLTDLKLLPDLGLIATVSDGRARLVRSGGSAVRTGTLPGRARLADIHLPSIPPPTG
jgi:hypothetical protein